MASTASPPSCSASQTWAMASALDLACLPIEAASGLSAMEAVSATRWPVELLVASSSRRRASPIPTRSDSLPARASAPPCGGPPAMSALAAAHASRNRALTLRPTALAAAHASRNRALILRPTTPKRSTAPTTRVKKMPMPASGVRRSSAAARPLVPLVAPNDAGSATCKGEGPGETPAERERDVQQQRGRRRA